MTKIKTLFVYSAVCFAIIVSPATIVSNYRLGTSIVKKAGLVVSPLMDGGKIVRIIDHDDYSTIIHEPVFEGLFSSKKKGFVQIDWIKNTEYPAVIREDIDFNYDGKTDFTIKYDILANKAEIEPYSSNVPGRVDSYKLRTHYMARIALINLNYK